MKQAAGTLLYRQGDQGLEVLLVHPSGKYNRNKPWSIPKGTLDEGEEMEETARRETVEETGVTAGELTPLGHCVYASKKKQVACFAGPAPAGADPRCASWEVDQACFVPIDRARAVLHADQRVFLDRLLELLAKTR